MQALVVLPQETAVRVEEIPIPPCKANEILVKVHAVALNKVDYLYTAKPAAAQERRVVGSDFAGTVKKVGEDVAKLEDKRVAIGARVAGFAQGAPSINERPGAFAEYVAVEYDLTWNIPNSMSFEDAASVSLCGLTAAQGLFYRMQMSCPFHQNEGFDWLDIPADEPINVFVYGATTSVGLYAAQLIRLSEKFSGRNIRLLGAASASKHEFLRQAPYSYDVLVDYKDDDWSQKIKAATENGQGVQYALDAFSVSPSVELTEKTFGPEGRFAVFRAPAIGGFDVEKLRIKPMIGAVWEGLGVEIGYQAASIPANAEARKFAAEFYKYLSSGIENGEIKLCANPLRRLSGGLQGTVDIGLDLVGPDTLKQRPLSAEKAVFAI